eukprot:CAMPEP_0197939562 /NCGR_PEP_ID=MMETSP1439-20131203/119869_1 /TAXON_ID=66791 /ORGANISM="Gonyaulax spinifera, Strain CCMP409" /LENGTH=303 /DNA_ID=CAMNT_0043562691 /DNA_START=65 /DNA_END=973 /DNA_ORIENTATION=+
MRSATIHHAHRVLRRVSEQLGGKPATSESDSCGMGRRSSRSSSISSIATTASLASIVPVADSWSPTSTFSAAESSDFDSRSPLYVESLMQEGVRDEASTGRTTTSGDEICSHGLDTSSYSEQRVPVEKHVDDGVRVEDSTDEITSGDENCSHGQDMCRHREPLNRPHMLTAARREPHDEEALWVARVQEAQDEMSSEDSECKDNEKERLRLPRWLRKALQQAEAMDTSEEQQPAKAPVSGRVARLIKCSPELSAADMAAALCPSANDAVTVRNVPRVQQALSSGGGPIVSGSIGAALRRAGKR